MQVDALLAKIASGWQGQSPFFQANGKIIEQFCL
jgi:hypothetical protein